MLFDVLETSLDAFHPIPLSEMAPASWGVTKPELEPAMPTSQVKQLRVTSILIQDTHPALNTRHKGIFKSVMLPSLKHKPWHTVAQF